MFRDTATAPSVGFVAAIQAGAFWGAVVLPFIYVPLLFTELDELNKQLLFAALVALNVILLIIGHAHRETGM